MKLYFGGKKKNGFGAITGISHRSGERGSQLPLLTAAADAASFSF